MPTEVDLLTRGLAPRADLPPPPATSTWVAVLALPWLLLVPPVAGWSVLQRALNWAASVGALRLIRPAELSQPAPAEA